MYNRKFHLNPLNALLAERISMEGTFLMKVHQILMINGRRLEGTFLMKVHQIFMINGRRLKCCARKRHLQLLSSTLIQGLGNV
jgi:hypothetical protein